LLVKRQGVDDILIALYVDILCLPKTMKEWLKSSRKRWWRSMR
jgi:hypothetical protein